MNETEIFGKSGNGTLDAVICHQIDASGGSWDAAKGDRVLNISIDDNDLFGIHSVTFRLTFGEKPEIENFFIKTWESAEAQISINFPMLCRIKDLDEDAIYQPDEVKMLLNECIKLKSTSKSEATDLALRKLFYCCEAALKAKLHLAFWCD
jgi:hypothetical protein